MPQRLHELARQRAEPAELADHHPQLGQLACAGRQALQLAHRRHPRTAPGLPGEHLECLHRVGAAHRVDVQPGVALEVLQRTRRARPEDPVDTTAVESDPRQGRLELADVVTAQVGRHQDEQAVTETPRGLDDRLPGLLVADAGVAQTTLALERAQRRLRGRAEQTRLGTSGRKPGGAEAALQIAYGLAALTGRQREVPRNSSSSCIRAPLPLAPTIFFFTSPPSKISSVGMLITE